MIGDTLYAGWWYLVTALALVAAFLATMILPTLSARWAALRGIARAALALTGIKVTVTGVENLPRGNAVILFNHTSYMDAVIIASVLPGEPAFVAKKEFADQPFAGSFMRRLGVSFVERFDAAASLADAEAVTGMAKAGRLFVFFPEGTFTRRAGLLGFYMGAFKVAAEANLPVVPGILRGVRTLLRGDQWFPRRTPISVVIEQPIQPAGTDFTAMLTLRDAARAAMLKHAGEPDLGALEKPPAPAWIEIFRPISIALTVHSVLSGSAASRLRRPGSAPTSSAYQPTASQESTAEEIMAWTTPTLVEICIGLEINGYLPAEF